MAMAEEREDEEKWLKHYASFHEILIVGDGDFSFSLCLANSFGSASNMVVTSLDSYDVVIKKYKNAKLNLKRLKKLGAYPLHGIDATKMKHHTDLCMRKFDRIIFNFPHAGFHGKEDNPVLIKMHRNLVYGFFRNSSTMLRANGEVHVNHKTTPPFCNWNLTELAHKNSLLLIECVDFKIEEYLGYHNKRGDGSRCDMPFPLGECSTFKFILSRAIHMQYQDQRPLLTLGNHGLLPMHMSIRNDCFRIFNEYFGFVVGTFGRSDYDVSHHVREALRVGLARFTEEDPRRPLQDYVSILEELRRISISRSEWLRGMLMGV